MIGTIGYTLGERIPTIRDEGRMVWDGSLPVIHL
jgi:hypothetical protein